MPSAVPSGKPLVESFSMATTAQQSADRQQIAQRIPGEKSSVPAFALFLGWLIPGGGHFLLGKYVRGTLLFVSILGLFLIGLGLQGKLDSFGADDLLDKLGFVGQLGSGLMFLLAKVMGWGASTVSITLQDYGTKFLLFAGLLNYISAIDAHALATGRKADLADDIVTVKRVA